MSTPLSIERIAELRDILSPSRRLIPTDLAGAFRDALDELVAARALIKRQTQYAKVVADVVDAEDKKADAVRAALAELVRTDDMFYAGLLTKNWSKGKGYNEYIVARKAAWAAARAAIEGRDAVPPNGGQQCET